MKAPVFLLFFALLFASQAPAENIVFPPDAATNIKNPPYSAVGDGVADDTAAIQKALDEGQHLIYLPNGTYRLTNALLWGKGQRRIVLQGQSKDGTILKLADECPGFNIPEKPLPVLLTGTSKGKGKRDRNGIRNLTVNTGRDNPGCIGIQFLAETQGVIDSVRIACGGTGPVGLDMGSAGREGPCLISRLEVDGFDTAISISGNQNSVTLDGIRLRDQRICGIRNDGLCVFARGLDFKGECLAFRNAGKDSYAILIDTVCEGTGAAKDADAVTNNEKCSMYVRNFKETGYRTAIKNDGGTQQSPEGATLAEWTSHPVISLFPSSSKGLGLPVKDAPEVPWDDLADWVSVSQFPATDATMPSAKGGKPVKFKDWTAAIQKAIDSGKTTVYFPKEGVQFNGTVHVHGSVRRIIGCEQATGKRGVGTWVIDEGEGPVIFERFDWSSSEMIIQNDTARAVIVSSVIGGDWQIGKNAGNTFFSDVAPDRITIGSGAKVWGRQVTLQEHPDTKIDNSGGTLWIEGLSILGSGAQVDTNSGAKTEIAGGFLNSNTGKDKNQPCFIVKDASFSASVAEAATKRRPFLNLVEETRGEETKTLRNGDTPARLGGSLLTLFCGFQEAD